MYRAAGDEVGVEARSPPRLAGAEAWWRWVIVVLYGLLGAVVVGGLPSACRDALGAVAALLLSPLNLSRFAR